MSGLVNLQKDPGPPTMVPDARLTPAPPPGGGAPNGGWKLPIRVRVPERDELLAMSLATLAVGLILGLAIGPGLGNAGRVLPIISPQLAQIPITPEVSDESSPESSLPVLAAPAGSDSATVQGAPAPVALASVPDAPSAPVEPAPEVPAATPPAVPAEPEDAAPPPDPVPQGLPVAGTVLAASVNNKSYSLADSSGNLQTIFSDFAPEPGERISTTVLPLVNGTFSEYGGRRNLATRERATVRGMVSFIDAELGVLVLSSRGTSLPLDGSAVSDELLPPLEPNDPEAPPPLGDGDWVEVKLVFEDPEPAQTSASGRTATAAERLDAAGDPVAEPPDLNLRIETLERLEETATRIELTGKLLELDRKAGRLVMSADSVGLLEGSIEITTPTGFDFGGVKVGRVYSATVRLTASGVFRLTGFSPGYSGKAADDRTEVYGEQGF